MACESKKPFSDISQTFYRHQYSQECLRTLFELSITDGTLFLTRCCRHVPISHRCEECYYQLPHYTLKYRQCRIVVYQRCRRDRLLDDSPGSREHHRRITKSMWRYMRAFPVGQLLLRNTKPLLLTLEVVPCNWWQKSQASFHGQLLATVLTINCAVTLKLFCI